MKIITHTISPTDLKTEDKSIKKKNVELKNISSVELTDDVNAAEVRVEFGPVAQRTNHNIIREESKK